MTSRGCNTVPQSDVEVLTWFEGCFESVFAVLHPFMRVRPEHEPLFLETEDGPTRVQLRQVATAVSWSHVIEILSLPGLSALNRLLLASIGAIRRGPDQQAIDRFLRSLYSHDLLPPDEGDFPPLLVDRFFETFREVGYSEVVVGDEFGESETCRSISGWLDRAYPWVVPAHPTLYSPDEKLLYGVHWDSFFTFLCGDYRTVAGIVDRQQLEGFFFEPGNRVYW